jgi:hypothetical protein
MLCIRVSSVINYSNNVLQIKGDGQSFGSSLTVCIPRVNILYYTSEDWKGDYGGSGTTFTFMIVGNTQIQLKTYKGTDDKIMPFLKDWEKQFESKPPVNIETADLLNI